MSLMEPEPVVLGNLSFEADVRRLELSISSDFSRHPVGQGADVADQWPPYVEGVDY